MYRQASSSSLLVPAGTTEFDILKASHRFLREDNVDSTNPSWEDQLAQKYYASLYREFALCDLKHYKSGNFALRWRTEEEVLSGAGEETCGNTRCSLHDPSSFSAASGSGSGSGSSGLRTVELPFAYEEHGEYKSALVKVVLCDVCLKKLMWKRERGKEKRGKLEDGSGREARKEDGPEVKEEEVGGEEHGDLERRRESGKAKDEHDIRRERAGEEGRKRRRSRSRSPSSYRRRREHKRHEHSPLK